MTKPILFFIAGIIQGSIPDGVHSQDYRRAIRDAITRGVPGAVVYCPFENHPNSLSYTDEKARGVFFDHIEMVAASDCLVAFVPQASMGTAVEMYAAREADRPVITISPLASNWTVKFLSDRILADVEEFISFVESGELVEFLREFKIRG